MDRTPPPWLLADTGTLLTLLLSDRDVPGADDNGLLESLTDLAAQGVIRFGVSDMVLAEFLGSYAPVDTQYLHQTLAQKPAVHTARQLPNGFARREERVQFIQKLLKLRGPEGEPACRVFDTKMGQQYTQAMLQHLREHAPELQDKHANRLQRMREETMREGGDGEVFDRCYGCGQLEVLTPQQMVACLRIPDHPLTGAAKRSNLRRDRGEISLADALDQIRQEEPQARIFICYEGRDVRGRIIQRYNHLQDNPQEPDAQWGYLPAAEYNPKNKTRFQPAYTDGMQGMAFVTTAGYLNALTKTAAAQGQHLFHPGEAADGKAVRSLYQELMANVRSYGLERSYRRLRDQSASQMNGRNEQYSTRHDRGAWLSYLRDEVPREQSGPVIEQAAQRIQLNRLNAAIDHLDRALHCLSGLQEQPQTQLMAAQPRLRERLQEIRQELSGMTAA